jgi:2-keto-4-pentenoate hydratase/2-oxohepta-3-ene-1,7-dioic acid hydratase in catechol pathway
MKFVRYQLEDRICYGVWEGEFVREIRGSIFEKYEITSARHSLDAIRLLAPVQPSKVICVGLNYRGHIEELGDPVPEFPSHFLKPPSAFIGPDEPILFPRIGKRIDYEGELAVVLKDRVKDVSETEAASHILGYTCFNDVTERVLTKVQGQLTRSKGFDTFASFGPCVATGLDPFNLTVRTLLNGKMVQEGNTRDLIFSVPFLIHYLSQCMTLLPGDIISTGTPQGIGPMAPGDTVEVVIEGIGSLRNRLIKA